MIYEDIYCKILENCFHPLLCKKPIHIIMEENFKTHHNDNKLNYHEVRSADEAEEELCSSPCNILRVEAGF